MMALSGTDGIGPVIFGGNEGIIECLKGTTQHVTPIVILQTIQIKLIS